MADWKKNTLHTLEITGYTAEGMGVARLEGRVVFIPGTIAGERWQVRLEKVNKSVAWGRGVQLLTPSPERTEPGCPLFGKCGGCQFRHMTYAEELRAKGQRVADAPLFWGQRRPTATETRFSSPYPAAVPGRQSAITAPAATMCWTRPTACFSQRPSPPCGALSRAGWRHSASRPMTRAAAPA